MVFGIIVRHNLNKTVMRDLLSLLNVIAPDCVPKNVYFFTKLASQSFVIDTHILCNHCGAYVCKYISTISCSAHFCEECKNDVITDPSAKNCNFFLMCSLESQLREILENCDINTDICPRTNVVDPLVDIHQGSEYLKRALSFPEDISLMCNIDGAQVFNSSTVSLYPVYYSINELCFKERKKHLVLHGLWCGKGKPRMESFLKPVTEELHDLGTTGFSWRNGNRWQTSKVHMVLCSCDSVARPTLQNIKQFNGEYGCSFCLHKGESVKKGRGYTRVYPENIGDKPPPRVHSEMIEYAAQALDSRHDVFGVKGPSLLYLIPKFDIIQSFNPEYMHSVLLGVVKMFCEFWFDTAYRACTFYCGAHMVIVDSMLCNIQPPSEIKRLPRSLRTRAYWKAAEWRSFLLFYSPVIMHKVLFAAHHKHWLLLVFAIHNLLCRSISKDMLVLCDMALHKFVYLIPSLYGKEHVSFNCHLLTHLATSVKQWGPLWATSAFVYEDANGKLLRMFHGTQHVSKQIFRNFLASRELLLMSKEYIANKADEPVVDLFYQLTHVHLPCKYAVRLSDELVGVGIWYNRNLTVTELVAVEDFVGRKLNSRNVKIFERMLLRGMIIHTSVYAEQLKIDDSVVRLTGKTDFFVVRSCIVLAGDNGIHDCNTALLLLKVFRSCLWNNVEKDPLSVNVTSHIVKLQATDTLIVCKPCDVSSKAVVITGKKGTLFAIDLPFFELD